MNFLYVSNSDWNARNPRQVMITSDPVGWIYAMRGEAVNYKDVDLKELSSYDLTMILLLPIPEALNAYLNIVRSKQSMTIVYVDGPVGLQCATMSVSDKVKFMDIMREADFVFTYGEEARGYFDILSGGKTVHYVNMPYPVEYIKSVQMQFKDKTNKIVALAKGFGCRRYDRNYISSWGVFARLQKEHPELMALAHPNHDPQGGGEERANGTYIESVFGIDTGNNEEGQPKFLELRMAPWMEYVRELSPCFMGVHLDLLYTRGQFPLECAGLHIPCICSGSDAGRKLFPQTFISNPWDIDRAVDIGNRLIEDRTFYDEVCGYAEDRLTKEFSYKVINEQVRKITGVV
ncbi:MAG: hypothetical protein A2Y38_04195 [Spirochaetes bacterium GWB1_59_5]|nr:MAG: hypothetical protein A2Y38_04195 [Spirochaetes bacterium GWB1_59_5]